MNSDTFNGLTVNFLHVYSGASYALQEINDRTSEGIDRITSTAQMVYGVLTNERNMRRWKAARWFAVAIAEIAWLTVAAIVITVKQWCDDEVDRCQQVSEGNAVVEAIDVTEGKTEEETGEEAIGPLVATVPVLALSKVSPNSRGLEKVATSKTRKNSVNRPVKPRSNPKK